MAAIDLSALPLRRMAPSPVDFGGSATSPLNGATTWIDRMGARWAFRCETPRMALEPDGRRWTAALTAARRAGVLVPISQPGFDVGAPGAPTVAAVTAEGRSVPITGATPGYAIRFGQWVSLVAEGQRYVDQIAAGAIVATDGTATIVLQRLLRAPLAIGASIELARPMVEGSIDFAEGWDVDEEETLVLAFTVTENA